MASRGCKVIIADCNIDKSVKDALVRETNNSDISLVYLDLASFTSVRKFAEELKNSTDKIDILINNAGIGRRPSNYTEDGIDYVLQVNFLSHFLLIHLILGNICSFSNIIAQFYLIEASCSMKMNVI